jgi:hypothetical protein
MSTAPTAAAAVWHVVRRGLVLARTATEMFVVSVVAGFVVLVFLAGLARL